MIDHSFGNRLLSTAGRDNKEWSSDIWDILQFVSFSRHPTPFSTTRIHFDYNNKNSRWRLRSSKFDFLILSFTNSIITFLSTSVYISISLLTNLLTFSNRMSISLYLNRSFVSFMNATRLTGAHGYSRWTTKSRHRGERWNQVELYRPTTNRLAHLSRRSSSIIFI